MEYVKSIVKECGRVTLVRLTPHQYQYIKTGKPLFASNLFTLQEQDIITTGLCPTCAEDDKVPDNIIDVTDCGFERLGSTPSETLRYAQAIRGLCKEHSNLRNLALVCVEAFKMDRVMYFDEDWNICQVDPEHTVDGYSHVAIANINNKLELVKATDEEYHNLFRGWCGEDSFEGDVLDYCAHPDRIIDFTPENYEKWKELIETSVLTYMAFSYEDMKEILDEKIEDIRGGDDNVTTADDTSVCG